MKKEWLVRIGVVAIALMVSATSVWAAGIGFYGAGGSTTADWDIDGYDEDADHDFSEFGFLFDTAVAQNSAFNYRMTIGYKTMDITLTERGKERDADGYTWGHTFGFAIVKNRAVRLWFGPKLEFAYLEHDGGDTITADLEYLGVGLGPALGLNIHAGPVLTVAITGGYQYTLYTVDEDISEEEYDITEGMPYGNLALIFRMGDKY